MAQFAPANVAEEEKMQRLLKDPILKPLLEDLCQWLGRILEIVITPDNFTGPLQTGDDLCRLALAISKKASEMGMVCPSLRFKAGAKAGSFQARCNIEAFVKWAKDLGVRETCLFETIDIVELKFLRNVLVCLLEISRLADKYGVEPPELVKLEKSTKIRWQDLIKLSMKRNSSGEVLSVAAISSAVEEIQEEVNKADEEGVSLERSSSVVKKWKSFTRTSLRSKGEFVSPDPDKIFEESLSESSPPESLLSNVSGSLSSATGSFILDEVTENQEEALSPTITVGVVGDADDAVVEFEEITGDQDSDKSDDALIQFEEITADLDSEKTEVVLTLEAVDLADDEDMTVEDISMEFDDIGLSVEQNLVEAVHSLPTLDSLGPTVDQQTEPTLESEPLVETEVILELETEDVSMDDEDMDFSITVQQNVMEVVHGQPQFDDGGDKAQATDKAVDVAPVDIVVNRPSTLGEEESEEEGSSEDEEYGPVSPQLQIEDSSRDVVVEELVLDPDSGALYERAAPVIPSAPAMEIMVRSEDPTASAGLAGSADDRKVDPSEKGGYTNLAYETDSGELQSGATGSAPVPAGRSQDEGDKVDITWWFALCFPAVVSGNKDGTSLSEDQVEELQYKRSVYLLVGIVLIIIGSALAITNGILGIDTGSGAEDEGLLTEPWFFVILGLALASLIIGLSLISLWVVQNLKMKNRKLGSFDKSNDYGSIR